jgi:hypothetical protein
MIERQVERLDPVFDRGLNTSVDTPIPGGSYVSGPSPWHVVPRALRKIGASDDDVFVDSGAARAGSSIRPRSGH